MSILALDTATPSTVVALCEDDGTLLEARDDPPAGERPRHAAAVLALAEELLGRAGRDWGELSRIAVGVGPGGFTGLRIGIATARALSQAHGLALVGISSLRALAVGAQPDAGPRPVLAAIDARRGEVFAAAWSPAGELLVAPAAYGPDALLQRLGELPDAPFGVGDGVLRFADALAGAGIATPDAGSPLHRVSGAALCRLGASSGPVARDALVPDYRREPDAKPPRVP
ncbi:MAG: tRNA threonylcarbamoyladenosine biosynthesis protein TsaB [uncultured Solirubrobacteraceae bacterium]|uniref:tRNA threonylcarbamoyladenosine biosynthesis protein TsaB n=1 Tax=uncultured Solirubrobacteraceae bacterium TaxID=1162706 RepID=A0A6J4SEM3_9ACTN|nr:MAG: tRNA threonylcarbamoyladenosine biosynthesis protein TsaB [uncultured Solirubrobacteraceae bacterium]